jgi:hydrogenase nickel incorporation protein HypA/HybF
MHELAIAEGLLKIVEDEGNKHALLRVRKIRLRIGKLSTVVPEALSFSFEMVSRGSLAEGADLVVDVVPVIGHCQACNVDFQTDDYFLLCPHCSGAVVALVSGKELEIVDIEGE